MPMKIGQLETVGTPGLRDAFHVAAVLVRAPHNLVPGIGVQFTDDTCTAIRTHMGSARHGIVDPFAPTASAGTLVWILLNPDSTKNLTHNYDIVLGNGLTEPEDGDGDDDFDDGCRGCYDEPDPEDEYEDDGCRNC